MVRLFTIAGAGLILFGLVQLSLPYVWKAPSFQPKQSVSQPTEQEQKKERLYTSIPSKGAQFAVMTIPKIDAKMNIIQGSHENELAIGAGHYDKSALPGESDNCVIGGHRDTIFRRLGELKKGDLIMIRVNGTGNFTYQVTGTRVVDKDDRTVIVSTFPEAKLSLVTCFPFGFIGAAPERYVVEANLVNSKLDQ